MPRVGLASYEANDDEQDDRNDHIQQTAHDRILSPTAQIPHDLVKPFRSLAATS
jgi:hypothetical protein